MISKAFRCLMQIYDERHPDTGFVLDPDQQTFVFQDAEPGREKPEHERTNR